MDGSLGQDDDMTCERRVPMYMYEVHTMVPLYRYS